MPQKNNFINSFPLSSKRKLLLRSRSLTIILLRNSASKAKTISLLERIESLTRGLFKKEKETSHES